MEMMKSILQDKLGPNEYWVEAMNTTIYWFNGSPSKDIKEATPEEA